MNQVISYEQPNGEDLILSPEQDELLQSMGVWPCDSEGRPFTNKDVLVGPWTPDLRTGDLLDLLGVGR